MTKPIHPTAIVAESAIIGENVQIGPFAVIGEHVEIGENSIIGAHVVLEDRTILGKSCQISSGAVIGGPPQDLSYKGEPTRVRIGDNAQIREYVTINRATGEGKETVLGNDCMMMAYSHVAHNCVLGNNVILANLAQVGGHVQIGDYVFLGGGALVHQNCRIGRFAFLGGDSGTRQDLPPFSMNEGRQAVIRGLNTIGLRRRGFSPEERQRLKKAFFTLWFSGLNLTDALNRIHTDVEIDSHVQELLDFVQSSKRGFHTKVTASAAKGGMEMEPEEALSV